MRLKDEIQDLSESWRAVKARHGMSAEVKAMDARIQRLVAQDVLNRCESTPLGDLPTDGVVLADGKADLTAIAELGGMTIGQTRRALDGLCEEGKIKRYEGERELWGR